MVSMVYKENGCEGERGLERGPGRELYRHYVTASSCAVASGRGLGLLPVHRELCDCQGGRGGRSEGAGGPPKLAIAVYIVFF